MREIRCLRQPQCWSRTDALFDVLYRVRSFDTEFAKVVPD